VVFISAQRIGWSKESPICPLCHSAVKALVAHMLPRYDLEPLGEPVVHAGFWTAEIHRGIRLRVHRRV
jgi:hypothetical protein